MYLLLLFIVSGHAINCFHRLHFNNTLKSVNCDKHNLCQMTASIDSSLKNYYQTANLDEYSCGTGEKDEDDIHYKYILQEYQNFKVKYLCLIEKYSTFYVDEEDEDSSIGTYLLRCICNENNCNSVAKSKSIKTKLKIRTFE
jgi:hypothetical protein